MNPDLVEYDKTISKGSENETQNEKHTIIEENEMSGRQYDNRGEFIVQADNTTSKADELTVETGQMVSSVKLIRESWLRRESNEKGGVFPKQWVKEKEEVTQQRKNAAQVHTDRKHNNKEENICRVDVQKGPVEKFTNKICQVGDNIKADHQSCFQEQMQRQTGHCFEEKEEVTKQRKNAAKVYTDRKHNYKEENSSRVDVQEGPVEKSTKKICKIGDNIKADQQSCFQKEIQRQTGHCFEEHILREFCLDSQRQDREEDQLKKYSYEDDKMQNKQGLDVKRMVERRLYPDESEQGLEKDSQSTEQLTTPVKTTVTDETPETSFMKSDKGDVWYLLKS